MYTYTILGLSLLASALAGPITYQSRDQTTSCAKRCRDTTKFNYTPGMTYEFEYDVQTHTAMEGASNERASLSIRATADIEVLSKCDMVLKLRDVTLHRSDPDSTTMKYADESGEFKRVLERFPLRFSFQDGVVEDLCPAEGENTWALNIKRGVLTVLQNSMDSLEHDQRVQEVDVSGDCPTQYNVTSKGWYTTSVRKTKDLLGCTDRTGFHSSVYATQYRVPSDIQSLPLMKSSQECEQQLDKQGVIQSVLLQETHTFRPFSQGNSGATTKVTQKLTFKAKNNGINTRQDYVRNRAGLKFEHVYGSGNKDELMMDAESKLREICENTREDIRPQTPRLFSELVYIVKNMAISDLRTVYSQVKSGSFCSQNNDRVRKFFLDSVPMASTSASVEFMTELLVRREVNKVLSKMWIASLSLVQNPTLEMIQTVKILLTTAQYTKEAMLPVSTMVNNYCSRREACSEERVITNIISDIEKVLGNGCYIRDSSLESAMVALRALGNAGHVGSMTRTLSSCFNKQENPIEVRVTAIQAFRRLPCTADRHGVLGIYQDVSEDSEVRIAAYLAVMQCPTEDILARIQEVLERERASQVGSFVWSHLTNLQESSSPQKQPIRRILENTELKKEFDLDTLKYSRNYEGSLFLEKFNTGAMLESNVIFSEKSFLPRSTMLNMTVDLFGHSLNLFEVGGRVEGLEYLIETYLGQYSYFGGRKAKSTVNLDRLRGDLYMRVFGNEMYYKHFKAVDPLAEIKGFNVMDMLMKMSKKQDYSFTQSVMFLDSTMIIPTSSGLPLNLTVNGTATIDLNASGQVDFRKRSGSPSSLLVEGHIQPSGAVEIAGTMSMDAFVTKTGLRVVNTWHSSTALKGRIELSRGKVLSVEIDFPQKKMEILDVSTTFFNVHGNVVREQKMLTDNRRKLELCTGSRLAEITGLELCNEFQWANASQKTNAPYFPFTGPFSQSLVLYKRDTHTGYYMLAKQSTTKYSTVAQIALNMPGSRTDRSLSLDFALDTKRNDVEMNLVSPWKKASLKGSISREANRVGMRGNLIVDEARTYGVISEIGIKKVKNVITYLPRVEIRRPQSKAIILSGLVDTEGMKRFTSDLSLTGVSLNPITLTGTIVNSKIEHSAKGTLSLGPKQDYSMETGLLYQDMGRKKSIIKISPTLIVKAPRRELISLTGSGEYKEGKSIKGGLTLNMYKVLDKPIIVKCDLKHSSGSKRQYSGTVMINSRVMVGKINGKVQAKKSSVSSFITVDYNFPKIRSIKKDKLVFSSKYTDRSTKSLWNYHLNTNFEDKRFPEVNFFTDLDFTHNNKHTESDVSVSWGPKSKDTSQQVSLYALVNHAVDDAAKIDYNVKTGLGPLGLKLNLKGKHSHDRRTLDSSFIFNYGKGKTVDASVSLRNTSKHNLNLQGEANLSYPGKSLILKTELVQAKNDYAHSVSLAMDKTKSTMKTNYRQQKDSIHQLDSTIDIHSFEPIQITATTDLDLKDFKASAKAQYGGDSYGASTAYTTSKSRGGKWSLDLQHPDRHVTFLVEGEGRGRIYQGTAETKWDADKDESRRFLLTGKLNMKTAGSFSSNVAMKSPVQNVEFNIKHAGGKQQTTRAGISWAPKKMIQVDTTFRNDKMRGGNSLEGSMRIKTPFQDYKELFIQTGSDSNQKRYSSNGQFSWGGKKKQVTYALNLRKPYTLSDFDFTVSGTSPFKGYKRMSAEVTHNMQPSMINTVVKGNMEGRNAKLTVTGNNRGTAEKRDFEGSATWKSTIKGMKAATMRLSHKDDSRKFVTDAMLELNGDKYLYDLDMNHDLSGWQFQNDGKLSLTSPRQRLVNTWQHRNTGSGMKSMWTSEWGTQQRVFINLFGNHDNSVQTKLSGGLTVQTPWTPVRNVEMNLEHEHGTGLLRHHSVMKQDNRVTTSADLNFLKTNRQMDSDFSLTSPMLNLKGKSNARYDSYPLSGHTELEWSPYDKASLDGSFSALTSQDFDSSIRLTTPFKNMRDIMLKASNKKEGSDLISRGSLNYGPRKAIEFESHIDADNMKMMRATLRTPFDDYKTIEGGLEYTGSMRNFDSRANFAVQPILGNFAGILNWNTDNDMTGKLRIDTPFHDYQYVQLFANSEMKGKSRHSRIEAEYYPRKTVSLDTSYSLGSPLMLDATFKSPYENLEHLSASLKHALRRSAMQTHAEVTYGPASTLEGDLRMKWANGLASSVVINTPFSGYELTKLSVRHEGKWDDMKTHGEVEFGKQVGEADMEFQHGFKTSGTFSIKTPIAGFEDTKVTINKRGTWDNLRGGVSISYGTNQNIEVTLQNKLTNRRLDTALLIKSPFSDDIRFTIDHDGQLRTFTTKVSGSIGSRHSIISETSVNMRYPLVDVSTNLQYTINWVGRNVGLKIHKEGYMDDISMTIIGTVDNKQVEITGMFKNKVNIAGSLRVQTPLTSYSDVGLSFRHNGDVRRFTTEGSIRYMDGQTLDGEITLSQSGLEAINMQMEIKTPFQGYENTVFKHRHSMSYSQATANTALNYGYSQRITSELSFETTPKIRIDAIVKTPFARFETSKFAFTNAHGSGSCVSHAEMEFLETSITADINSEIGDYDARLAVTVTTNIREFELMKVSINREGTWENYSGSFAASLKDSTIEAAVTAMIADEMKGTFSLMTPFQNFRDTSVSVSHSWIRNKINSEGIIRYMDGKVIDGKVSLSHNGFRQMQTRVELKTPFQNFRDTSVSVSHSCIRNKISSEGAIRYMDGKAIEGKLSFSHDGFRQMQTRVELMTPFQNFRDTSATFTHSCDGRVINSEGMIRYMDGKVIDGKVSFSHDGFKQIQTRTELRTPFRDFEETIIEHSHTARPNYLKSNSALTYGRRQQITSAITLDTNRDISVDAVVRTPFTDFEVTRAMITSSGHGSNYRGNMDVEFMKNTIKVDATFENAKSTQGNLVMTTNIPGYENMRGTFSAEGDWADMRTTGLLNWRDSTLKAELTARVKDSIQGSLIVNTPFQDFNTIEASIRHSGSLSKFDTEGRVQYMDGKSVEGKVSFTGVGLRSIRANAELKTPFIGYETQTVEYHHSIRNARLTSNLVATYGQNMKITLTANGQVSPKIDINAALTTPFRNFENSRIVFTHEGPAADCRSHLEIYAVGTSIKADSEIESSRATRGTLNLETNIEGVKNVKVAYSKDGEADDMKATGSLGVEGSTLDVSVHNIFTARRLFTDITIKNPYTEVIDMKMDITGRLTNFKSKLSVSMGDNTGISSDSMFRVRNSDVDIRTGLVLKVAGEGQSTTMKFHKEGELKNMKMDLSGDLNGKKSSVNVEFRAMDDVHAQVKVSTPIRSYRNTQLSFDHSGSLSRFTTQAMIRYMDRKEITGKLEHSNQGIERINSNMEVRTPFSGYELTTATIQHTATSDAINCHAGVHYGRGQEITGDLQATISPKYEIDIQMKTPFRQYEDLSSSASLEISTSRYVIDSKLNAGNGNRFSFDSTVDMDATPMTAVASITSPFENFESAQISLTHDGELRNFRSTGSMETPMTGMLASEVSVKYTSPVEMDVSITLPRDITLAIQNSHSNDKYRSHLACGWSPRQEVAFDGSYQFTDNWSEKLVTTEFSLTTPFEIARHAAVKFDHHQGQGKYMEKLEADYNGETVLDMDVELTQGQRDKGSITMRKPRPMQITLAGDIAEKNIDGEMFVNWDRDEPRSNIRVQTSMTDRSQSSILDKDLKVKLIHPTRTMAIIGNIMQTSLQTRSRGEFIWNEAAGQSVFYDMDLKDASRRYSKMYDGTIKMGSPLRTVQMDGSYSEKGVAQTVDGSFSWDVERDASKQVGLKAVFTPSEHNKKMDLALRLPSVGKDIKLDTELLLNDGRVLFNGQTRFTYSNDYRKTLTITSRLDDISTGYGNTNYSFAMGISHPYTDVNVQVRSHVGSSSEKYSGSVDMQYLTDRRENKNFALRGEIDKLRRQIELQMKTPMTDMSMMGEIKENPFQVNVVSRHGDKTLQTELTVDASRRTVDFSTNYDLDDPSKTLRVSAKYINSTALQAVMYHEVNSRRVSDSLLALRLNSSRLLHTRLSWRPSMVQDIQEFLTRNIEQYGSITKADLHSVYEAVGDELSGKYHRITQAISEEATTFIRLLEAEMAAIEKQLDSVRRDIRRMYRRNDLYIADMNEYITPIFDAYKEFVGATKDSFAAINERIAHFMDQMNSYPIRQNYQAVVEETVANFKRAVDTVVADSVEVIARLDEELSGLLDRFQQHYSCMHDKITDSIRDVQNHPQVAALKSGISHTYQQYLDTVGSKVSSLELHSLVSRNFAEVMKREDVKHVMSLTNDAYQEGVWAYNYWKVEENLKQHLKNLVAIARDLAEDEIRQYAGDLKVLGSSRVTVWDPEHGEIQMEVYLPVPLQSLDSLPELQSYVSSARSSVDKYITDATSLGRYYNNYMPSLRFNQTRPDTKVKTNVLVGPKYRVWRKHQVVAL